MSEFNPYAAPESAVAPRKLLDENGCWRSGDLLVLTKDAELPDRCFKCNGDTSRYRLKRNLSWHHPLWFVLAISPLIYLIVALLIRQKATLHVGLCPAHRSARKRALLIAWLVSLAGIACMILGPAFLASEYAGFALVGGLVVFLGGLVYGSMSTQITLVKKIDKRFVWLRKVDPGYLAAFPAWPGA